MANEKRKFGSKALTTEYNRKGRVFKERVKLVESLGVSLELVYSIVLKLTRSLGSAVHGVDDFTDVVAIHAESKGRRFVRSLLPRLKPEHVASAVVADDFLRTEVAQEIEKVEQVEARRKKREGAGEEQDPERKRRRRVGTYVGYTCFSALRLHYLVGILKSRITNVLHTDIS